MNSPEAIRKRIGEIIEIGSSDDAPSRIYDLLGVLTVLINLTVSFALTFEELKTQYGSILYSLEWITIVFFAVDYILRVWCAKYLFPSSTTFSSVKKYVLSFSGIIDLLSFLPYFLPVFFPGGTVVFRMFRVIRIFRLFRINSYYDSLNVITEVLYSKSTQLISSVFIILMMILASSLCMYSIEHNAQPTVFTNAFSGIWWAAATLFTVGYGDIYPITPMGQTFSIVITFLGVGLVAIPTGIISAGFVEQYTRLKRISEYQYDEDVHFLKFILPKDDPWVGKKIKDLSMPAELIVAAVYRGLQVIVPDEELNFLPGDLLILCAEKSDMELPVYIRRLKLKDKSSWNGKRIEELDMPKKTIILMVERKKQIIKPEGNLMLKSGDEILIYSKHRYKDSEPELF